MLSANARITQRHHWDSVYWEWVLNLRGLLMFSKDASNTYTAAVYLLTNPVVAWFVVAALILTLLLLVLAFRCRAWGVLHPEYAALDRWTPTFRALGFLIVLYVANLLPYVAVSRSCFIYHYLPALMYGEVAAASLLDVLAGTRFRARVFGLATAVLIVSFVYYAPWIYALPLTNDAHARRRWLPRWD